MSLIKEVKSRGQEGRAVQNMLVKLRICVVLLSLAGLAQAEGTNSSGKLLNI